MLSFYSHTTFNFIIFLLHIMAIFIGKNFQTIITRAIADPFQGFLEDGRLHGDIIRFAGIGSDRYVRRCNARSSLLTGNRR